MVFRLNVYYTEIFQMSTSIKTIFVVALVIAFISFLMFGGSPITGSIMSGEMMGNQTMDGMGWMWMPGLLFVAIAVLAAWLMFGNRK